MALFESFRHHTARRALAREAAPVRQRKGVNLHNAERIGLLYVDSDEPAFKQVKALQRHFTSEYGTRRVEALGYVDAKEKQLPIWQSQTRDLTFFSKDHLNWYFKPTNGSAEFENTPFDVLIDLTDGSCVPLQFVVRRSKAAMKVGRATAPLASDYDFTLDVPENADQHSFLQTLERYLAKLNFV